MLASRMVGGRGAAGLSLALFVVVNLAAITVSAADMAIVIDARDLPRKLLSSRITIPLEARPDGTASVVSLWYPKWVPGSHGPGGPVQNVAGLRISDAEGKRLEWRRAAGEVYRVDVQVPNDCRTLIVEMQYITNQPSTGSMGHDSFGSAEIGIVSASTLLMIPEGVSIDETQIDTSVHLPTGWFASCALRPKPMDESNAQSSAIQFEPTSLRDLVDSPLMCGVHRKIYNLVEANQTIPPHEMHVFSEAAAVLDIDPELQRKFSSMVAQTAKLFESHPYDSFTFLLATSDTLERNGLEHSRCSLNVLGQRSLQDAKRLKGWDRLLVPHEYLHAWCGKYRRPAGMCTHNFQASKDTELLWVYEGLTQYLGEVIEARSGFMTQDEFLHRVAVEIRRATHVQGREWRSLVDTGACSHILRARSDAWPGLRRSQDYYMEGMLFWLEADIIIRKASGGQRSLDDFCRAFFRCDSSDLHPKPYSRSEIVETLDSIVAFDWDGLIKRRVESLVEQYDASFINDLGYTVTFTDDDTWIPGSTFRKSSGLDGLDSIGAVLSTDGRVADLLVGSPSHQAGLGPGMRILAIDGHAWSVDRMRDALIESRETGRIKLLVENGDLIQPHELEYGDGIRFMKLKPNSEDNDMLKAIVAPL
jgi:predicted metalloprotease with PDZ domain